MGFNKRKEKKNELNTLDINQLSNCITEIMGKDRLQDYIFMTLLLGNDFMPHFPGLNIRTTGFDTLLSTYVKCIQPTDKLFDKQIQLPVVRKLIQELALVEEHNIIKDYVTRSRYRVDESTPDKKVNNMPMVQRSVEHYIAPNMDGWQKRYYHSFFNHSIDDICKNYIEMLEWNMMYYNEGCKNWGLYYHYMYPPLLQDLCQRIPDMTIRNLDMEQINSDELLSYVLPKPYWHLLPMTMQETKKKELYKEPILVWAFCKYTWESHVMF